jgi:hypothetical protein
MARRRDGEDDASTLLLVALLLLVGVVVWNLSGLFFSLLILACLCGGLVLICSPLPGGLLLFLTGLFLYILRALVST